MEQEEEGTDSVGQQGTQQSTSDKALVVCLGLILVGLTLHPVINWINCQQTVQQHVYFHTNCRAIIILSPFSYELELGSETLQCSDVA